METEAADSIVTVAEADFVGVATEVAVTVTCAGFGSTAGAVYKPPEVIDPQAVPEQPAPDTVQFTAVFELPVTTAENCCCPDWAIVVSVGEMVMPTLTGDPIITLALPD
jgi:hypothetical protein